MMAFCGSSSAIRNRWRNMGGVGGRIRPGPEKNPDFRQRMRQVIKLHG